MLSMISKLQIR